MRSQTQTGIYTPLLLSVVYRTWGLWLDYRIRGGAGIRCLISWENSPSSGVPREDYAGCLLQTCRWRLESLSWYYRRSFAAWNNISARIQYECRWERCSGWSRLAWFSNSDHVLLSIRSWFDLPGSAGSLFYEFLDYLRVWHIMWH